MPRPLKKRFVCRVPDSSLFTPSGAAEGEVVLTVDEYEVIRLIDLEGDTQEECAGQIHVSRTTVQSIYDSARKKIADAIVNGKSLHIIGGDYITCDHYTKLCGKGCRKCCHKHHCQKTEDKNENCRNV